MISLFAKAEQILREIRQLRREIADVQIAQESTKIKLEVLRGLLLQNLEISKRIEQSVTPPPAVRLALMTEVGGILQEVTHMELKVSDKRNYAIVAKDKFGNVTSLDSKEKPAWAVSDPALADLAIAEDGMSADVMPKGPVGNFLLQVSGDADLGDGVKPITGEASIELLPGEAVSIELAPGEAAPQ